MRDKILYNDVNTTRAVIDRCSWSVTVHDTWMASQEVLFNLARGFENVCEIIADLASESFVKV